MNLFSSSPRFVRLLSVFAAPFCVAALASAAPTEILGSPETPVGLLRPAHPLELRIPPLAVTGLAGCFAWISAGTFPALRWDVPAPMWLAGAFILLGFICCGLGVAGFRRARTTVNPIKPGTATALVSSGIYRVTRNPMYLGFLFFLLGEIVWLAHPLAILAALGFVPYLNRFQIIPEEQALRDRFGLEYAIYRTRVRRWL